MAHQHPHTISEMVINGASACQEERKGKTNLFLFLFTVCHLEEFLKRSAQCTSNLVALKGSEIKSGVGSASTCFLPCCCWKAWRTLMTQSVFRALLSATWHQSFFLLLRASSRVIPQTHMHIFRDCCCSFELAC